jgi:hypothetical protein
VSSWGGFFSWGIPAEEEGRRIAKPKRSDRITGGFYSAITKD